MEQLVIKYGIIYIIFFLIILCLFRRMLYSIFDPAIFLIPTLASLLALSIDSNLFFYVTLAIIFFWLGMITISKNQIHRNFNRTEIYNALILKVFTTIIVGIYIICMLYVFATNGIPLFSDIPSEAKTAVFEGNGILRRVSFLSKIIPINLILLILTCKKNRLFICMLVIYCLLTVMLGSKSSLLGLIFPLAYFMTQKNIVNIGIKLKNLKSWIFKIGIVSLGILVFIVSKEAKEEGSDFIYSLGFRLMEFGDVALYYSADRVQTIFNNYSFLNFIPDELNGILGMLRIAEYKKPLGYIMVTEYTNLSSDVITGPNALFIIKGDIYFGFIGGLLYCFIWGVLFAYIRKLFFTVKIKDLMLYSVYAFIFFNCMGLLRESGSFWSLIFDYGFFTIPILFIAQLLVRIYDTKKIHPYDSNRMLQLQG